MSTPPRTAPSPAELEAFTEKLARSSRWAGVISLVGLLLVLGALLFATRQLSSLNREVAVLGSRTDSLDRQIEAKRAELRTVTDSLVRTREAYSAYRTEVRRSQPALAAAAAEVARDSAAAARLVYIQFRGAISRTLVNQLRQELNAAGYNAPGVERIDRDFRGGVRYFHAADAEAARVLAARAEVFFAERGCPVRLPVQDVSARGAGVPTGQLEVWVNLNCRARS